MGSGGLEVRTSTLARDGWECRYCGAPATLADHVIPVGRYSGAHDDPENLVPACTRCNNSKRDQTVEAWCARTGRDLPIWCRKPERHERDGAPVPTATFAYHRHVGPDGAGLYGHMGTPWPDDAGCPPDCPLPTDEAA